MAHKATTTATAGIAQAVTVHTPVDLGGPGVFAVQAGVPLGDAMDAMALLLDAAGDAACEAAIAAGSDNETPGTAWAVRHLLVMARCLNLAIHGGLLAAQEEAR